MKNSLMKLLAAALMLPASAFAFELDGVGAADIGSLIPESVIIPSPVASVEEDRARAGGAKEWTVMVFLNAKNDLERFGMQDINEMEMVGSTDRVNVVVEMGRMAGYDDTDGNWTGVRRYFVTRDFNRSRIGSTMVENLGQVNMGDSRELANFVRWAKSRYPARKYLLVLWNHGSGWVRGNPVQDSNKGISYDEVTGNNIDTPQLGRVLAETGGVDLLASDACLMQMAEIAYEVRGGARYVVGSEETEPGAGYAYYKVLLPLALNPGMSAETLGRFIVTAYWDSNKFGRTVATHSLLDSSVTSGLAARMNEFAAAAMASGDKAAIRSARDAAQSYAMDDNKDLVHFANLVAEKTRDAGLRAAARRLSSQITGELVLLNMTSILPRSNSNGIAAYVPGSRYDGNFDLLALSRDTRWDDFLKWMVAR